MSRTETAPDPTRPPALPDPSERPTLTVPEVARLLGMHRGLVYEAIRHGDLPSLRLGRRVVVPTGALRRLLAAD